ncbi:hypothetical protein HCX16_23910 [Escherichia coli]|nr:hypothetical protein [Escherichia coli]
MLQIIRGKLVIFLITLCLFVVYLGFDNNSNSDIVFYGHKTPKSVEIYLSEKNITYKIINDQKISRGNGHFISIMVNNYRTHCGVVDINLNFFNDILYSVRLKNISKLENMEFCAKKQRVYFSDKNKKASYKIINYGDYYDVDYYDNNLKNEVFDWIGKWS